MDETMGFERGILVSEFGRVSVANAPADAVTADLPTNLSESAPNTVLAQLARLDGQADKNLNDDVAAEDPASVFLVGTTNEWKASSLAGQFERENDRQHALEIQKNPTLETMKALWQARSEEEFDALLASLTPEQIKQVGTSVSADYAEKARIARTQGNDALAEHMSRMQSASDLYTQYLLQGYSPAAARQKLERENGYSSSDVHELDTAFLEKAKALGFSYGTELGRDEVVADTSEAVSTENRAALLGEVSKVAPPVDVHFKQAVQPLTVQPSGPVPSHPAPGGFDLN